MAACFCANYWHALQANTDEGRRVFVFLGFLYVIVLSMKNVFKIIFEKSMKFARIDLVNCRVVSL
jgi:hypothetical protein